MYLIKASGWSVYKEETGDLTDNSIQAALCDSEGNLWFGSFYGRSGFFMM